MELTIIKTIILDFDGVLTDNYVYVNEEGIESVRCSRSDGFAFSILKKNKINVFILSTEKNDVVLKRAEKLNIACYRGVSDKAIILNEIAKEFEIDLSRTLYIGNDLNDLEAMRMCKFHGCPVDSHIKIRAEDNIFLTSKGGCGIIRELVEEKLRLMDDI